MSIVTKSCVKPVRRHKVRSVAMIQPLAGDHALVPPVAVHKIIPPAPGTVLTSTREQHLAFIEPVKNRKPDPEGDAVRERIVKRIQDARDAAEDGAMDILDMPATDGAAIASGATEATRKVIPPVPGTVFLRTREQHLAFIESIKNRAPDPEGDAIDEKIMQNIRDARSTARLQTERHKLRGVDSCFER